MQADIDQNESDADTAIAANTTSINNLIGGNSAFTSINVDGGSIDGATIGATTASTGAFTTLTSSGATSLATGGGAVNVATSGVMTTVKGTLNVDEAVTLDTTLDVTGRYSWFNV